MKLVLDKLDGLVRVFQARRVLREHIRVVGPSGPYIVADATGSIRAVKAADAIRIDMKDGQATLYAGDRLVSQLPATGALHFLLAGALRPRRPVRTLVLCAGAAFALMLIVGVVEGVKKGFSTTLPTASSARSAGAEGMPPPVVISPSPSAASSRPLGIPQEAASVLKQ